MRTTGRWFFTLVILLAGWDAAAQQASPPARTLSPDTDCYYLPGPDVRDLYEFDPSPSVVEQVSEIAKVLGLDPQRFDVKSANVPNASAILRDNERKILYSTTFLNDLASTSAGKWATTAVLAHEVSHHADGHPLNIGPDRKHIEITADEASGLAVCQLGGTLRQAQSALAAYGGQTHPAYPDLSVRLEAVARGWYKAFENGRCKDIPDPGPTGVPITKAENIVVITPENVDSYRTIQKVTGAAIRFENVRLEVKKPLVLLANRITFDERSGLRGKDLKLIAVEIEGGQIEADGEPGEHGGKILVAAERVQGTTLSVRGGDGLPGGPSADGRDGRPGRDGTNGECGPGMLDQFIGSTAGAPGESGSDGQDGGPGGSGGNGGQIYLLTFQKSLLSLDVGPGEGGNGGPGGRGGHGGPGGRGGAGCQGIGGSQPTRPDGTDGAPGRNGRNGAAGARGRQGRVWNVPIAGSIVIRKILEETDITEATKRFESLAVSKDKSF